MKFATSLAIILAIITFFFIIFSSIFQLTFINVGYNRSMEVELNNTLNELNMVNDNLEYCEDYKGINQDWGAIFWFLGLIFLISTQIMFYNSDLTIFGKKKE